MACGGSCGCGGTCGGEKAAAPGDSSSQAAAASGTSGNAATPKAADRGGSAASAEASAPAGSPGASAPADSKAEGKSAGPATGKDEGTIVPQDTAVGGGGGGGDGGESLLVTEEDPCNCFCWPFWWWWWGVPYPFADFLDVVNDVALPPTTVENAGIVDIEHAAMDFVSTDLAAIVVTDLPTIGAPLGTSPVSTLSDLGVGIGAVGPLGLGAASEFSGSGFQEPGGLQAGPYGYLDESAETMAFAGSTGPRGGVTSQAGAPTAAPGGEFTNVAGPSFRAKGSAGTLGEGLAGLAGGPIVGSALPGAAGGGLAGDAGSLLQSAGKGAPGVGGPAFSPIGGPAGGGGGADGNGGNGGNGGGGGGGGAGAPGREGLPRALSLPRGAIPATAVFRSAPGTALTPGSAPTAAVVPWNDDGGGGANTEAIPIAILVEPPDSRVLGEAPPPPVERDLKSPPHAGNFAFGGVDARAGAGLWSLGFPAIDHGFEEAGYDLELVTLPAGPAASDLPDSLSVARPVQGRIGSADLEDHGFQSVPDQAFAIRGTAVADADVDPPGSNSARWADLDEVPKPGSATGTLAEPQACCTATAAGLKGSDLMPNSGVVASGSGAEAAAPTGAAAGSAVPLGGGDDPFGTGLPQLGGGGGGGGLGGAAAAKTTAEANRAYDTATKAGAAAEQKKADARATIADPDSSEDAKASAYKDIADAEDQKAKAEDAKNKAIKAGATGEDPDESDKRYSEAYQEALDAMGGNAEQLDKLIADEQSRQENYATWAEEREGKERKRVRNYDAQKKADAALRSSRSSRDTNNSTKSALSGMKGSGLNNPKTPAGSAYKDAKGAYKDAKDSRKEAKKAAKDAKRAATYGTKEQGDRAAAKAETKAAVADAKSDYAAAKTEEAKVKADKKSTKAQKLRAEANSAQGKADVKQAEANDKDREADNAESDAKKDPDNKRKQEEAKKQREEANEAQEDADKAQEEADKADENADEEEEKENPSPPPPPPCTCVPPCPPGTYCFCVPPPPPGGDPVPGGGGGGKGKGAPGDSVMPDDTKNKPAGAEKGDEEGSKHPGDGDEDRYADPEDRDGGGEGGGDGDGGGQGRGHAYGIPTEPPLFPPDGHQYARFNRQLPGDDDDEADDDDEEEEGPSPDSGSGAHVYAQERAPEEEEQEEEEEKPRRRRRPTREPEDPCEKLIAEAEEKAEQEIREAIRKKMKKNGRSESAITKKQEAAIKKFRDDKPKREKREAEITKKVYAEADAGTRSGEATIDHKDAYFKLPAYVRHLVDSHEQVHVDDFKGVLKKEVDAIRAARQELKGKRPSTGPYRRAQRALNEAVRDYNAALKKTECRAYADTYQLMKKLGPCGYAHFEKLLKDVVRVIKANCRTDDELKAALGDDYDEYESDYKKYK